MTKVFIAIIASALLVSCAAPQVITASDTSISVEIKNTGMTTSEMLKNGTKVAEEHCAKYGKKPNLVSTSGFWGAAHIATYDCR
jgi:uncharacterized protein YcfL